MCVRNARGKGGGPPKRKEKKKKRRTETRRLTTTGAAELSRTLATLQAQHADLTAGHSGSAHASAIAALDTRKFRTAKAASDLEMEAERLALVRDDAAARLRDLDAQGVEGSDPSAAADDHVLLRLKVYRSLGVELERDGAGDGGGGGAGAAEFARAVVRNDRRGDVQVVNMDRRFSPFFYANYFWQML